MSSRIVSRLGDAGSAFSTNVRDGNLRSAQSSFALAWTGEWALTVGLGVFAYRAGGAAAVGLVTLLRMLPSALITPLAGPLADRVRREHMLMAVCLVRALTIGAATVLVAAEATAGVYALAAVATVAHTLYRPAHSALLPSLCHTARDLAGANVVRGLLDSAAIFAGPAVATILLAVAPLEAVFAAAAVSSALAGLALVAVRYEPPPREAAPEPLRPMADLVRGLRAVREEWRLALLIGVSGIQAATRGAVTVLTVVVAIDLLETGEAGVGALTTAIGVGAVLGSLGASLLVGSHVLARWLGIGAALWGVPLSVLGIVPSEAGALLLLSVLGVGNALVDVGLFTLPARLVPDDVLGRVFGVLESAVALAVAVASVLEALLVEWLGIRTALIVTGLVAPAVVAAAWSRLRALDQEMARRDVYVRLLRRVPMLEPLPLPAIELLATRLEHVAVDAGEPVFEEGDTGDRFYVIIGGDAEVSDGTGHLRDLGRGDAFGEIALLRDCTRTATVRARGDLRMVSLRRDEFVAVVGGFSHSRAEAEQLMRRLLGEVGEAPAPSV